MTKPTWAKILGVLMILIGGCGATQDLKLTKTNQLIEFQSDLLEEIDKNGDINIDSSGLESLKKMVEKDSISLPDSLITGETLADSFNQLTYIPPTVATKLIKHGYLGYIFSLLYVLAGIALLTFRKHVIKIVYGVVILCLAFALYQHLDLRNAGLSSLFKIGLNLQNGFGALIDIIVLVTFTVVGKEYFRDNYSTEPEDYYDTA